MSKALDKAMEAPSSGVSRRSFGLLAGGAATLMVVGPTPSAAAATTYQSVAQNPKLVVVGPAAVFGQQTVVRVTSGKTAASELEAVGMLGTNGSLSKDARLLGVEQGQAEAPVASPPYVRATSAQATAKETYLVFPMVASTSTVTLMLPGFGVVDNVPVVPAAQAPFVVS
ncbi:Uncharacterised protein [Actinomyces bovis]|uniref:Secreted protein n=1 Tax=Actinomyces bovis TaxID=1658 RepID=A0ABY1VMR7_9ACTO|nr:hypothetical protein [Actinomyces bovis]SPT53123.1 Uncharacterised protein [Actinomyces bovis]VEG52266.1 Uncharacterised protein [Actinomyces israelii]